MEREATRPTIETIQVIEQAGGQRRFNQILPSLSGREEEHILPVNLREVIRPIAIDQVSFGSQYNQRTSKGR